MNEGRIDPSATIHETAVIAPDAIIGRNAQIGAYCVIGPQVSVGDDSVLHPAVKILSHTTIGRNCQVFSEAVLGGPPQDHKFENEQSFVQIGDDNIIRECVTIHRATGEGEATRIGNRNMLMSYVHIGHNCQIGDDITFASYVGLSGHVLVEDRVNFGGICGIHQFCRIGTLAMIGGMSGVAMNIPPYALANGRPARVYDINKIGLKRVGISIRVRNDLRLAYKLLYHSNLNMSQALDAIDREGLERSPELDHLLQFIRSSRDGKNFRGNNQQEADESTVA